MLYVLHAQLTTILDIPHPRELLHRTFLDLTHASLQKLRKQARSTLYGTHRNHLCTTNNTRLATVRLAHLPHPLKSHRFFWDWYAVPTDLDPEAHSFTTIPDWWKQLLHLPLSPTIPVLHPNSRIPAHLQHSLRKVCQVKAFPAIQKEISSAVDLVISSMNSPRR